MKSRLWLNLLLALSAVVLGILYIMQPDDPGQSTRPRLHSLAPQMVERIQLMRRGEPDIILQREEAGWMLTTPLKLPANPVRVDTLLQLLNQHHYGHFSLDELDLPSIGLDSPVIAVAFNETRFEFGGTDPLSQRRYVRIDNEVYLLDDRHFAAVVARLPSFIDLRLLRGDDTLVSLQLPGIKLERGEQGWQIDSEQRPHSGDDLLRLVQTWQSASALEVTPVTAMNSSSLPLITLGLKDNPSIHLYIIRRQPDLILWRPDLGLRYRFTAHQARQMLELSPDRD